MSFKLGDNIILRNPDFGDIIRVDNNDIRRFSRGGNIFVYATENWPILYTHIYKFSRIRNLASPNDLVDQVKDFLRNNAGLEITIIDHYGTTYTGYITSPINEIIAVRPDCSYDISFEFLRKMVV